MRISETVHKVITDIKNTYNNGINIQIQTWEKHGNSIQSKPKIKNIGPNIVFKELKI